MSDIVALTEGLSFDFCDRKSVYSAGDRNGPLYEEITLRDSNVVGILLVGQDSLGAFFVGGGGNCV